MQIEINRVAKEKTGEYVKQKTEREIYAENFPHEQVIRDIDKGKTYDR